MGLKEIATAVSASTVALLAISLFRRNATAQSFKYKQINPGLPLTQNLNDKRNVEPLAYFDPTGVVTLCQIVCRSFERRISRLLWRIATVCKGIYLDRCDAVRNLQITVTVRQAEEGWYRHQS